MTHTTLDTLDTLFGDIDDLLSDHQTSDTGAFTYNGDTVYEPAKWEDKSRVMHDMMDKLDQRLPGITFTDDEFLSSGYISGFLPDIGPFKAVELHVKPVFGTTDHYEFHIQWGGYSQPISQQRSSSVPNYMEDDIGRLLGRLWVRCYHGLCAFKGWKPFQERFPTYGCKNIDRITIASEQIKNLTIKFATAAQNVNNLITSNDRTLREYLEARELHCDIVSFNDTRLVQFPRDVPETSIYRHEYAVGDLIRFKNEKKPYRVKAMTSNGRFLICTKPFNLHHTCLYTIVDFEKGIRGPDNHYGLGYETLDDIKNALTFFENGTGEISRNHITLNIGPYDPTTS